MRTNEIVDLRRQRKKNEENRGRQQKPGQLSIFLASSAASSSPEGTCRHEIRSVSKSRDDERIADEDDEKWHENSFDNINVGIVVMNVEMNVLRGDG